MLPENVGEQRQLPTIGEHGGCAAFEEQEPKRLGVGDRPFGKVRAKHDEPKPRKVVSQSVQRPKRRFTIGGIPFQEQECGGIPFQFLLQSGERTELNRFCQSR